MAVLLMKNALLVDDDQVTNLINRKVLQQSGLFSKINIVSNGMQALDFLKECQENSKSLPDNILLDLNMPIMSGFLFLEELSKLTFIKKNIKIIILSSSDNYDDIKRSKELGIEDYLIKPISSRSLLNALA
jgi:CheY-like chemotaxis protein